MKLFQISYFEYSRGFRVGYVTEQLPVGWRRRVGPAPVDHAHGAHRQRRHASQKYHRVVDIVSLSNSYEKLCFWQSRKVRLNLYNVYKSALWVWIYISELINLF